MAQQHDHQKHDHQKHDRRKHDRRKGLTREERHALLQPVADLSNPQERYRRLLADGGFLGDERLVYNLDPENTAFVLGHPDLFSSARDVMALGNTRPLIPLNLDPPTHTKYRLLLNPLFSAGRMAERRDDFAARANALIDGFLEAGECNFTEDYAEIFPSSVFLGLLGLAEDELGMFLGMRDGILHPERIDPAAVGASEAVKQVRDAAAGRIYEYFGELVDRRRVEPTDDIISRFIEAEVDGDVLSRDDIVDIMFLFVIAGLDTVSDSLTCFFAYLATHPDQQRLLVDDPGLIPSAVEELLRWETPVAIAFPRTATRDVTLPRGQQVREGCPVFVNLGASNLDPASFDEPYEVRLDRPKNRHIAFGKGVHRCLGSHLARHELAVTLAEWHRRIPEYRLKPGHEELDYKPGIRHVQDLMLSWAH